MNTYIKDRVEEEELESWLCSYHGGIMAGNDELAKKMFLATINNRLTQAYQQGEKKGAEGEREKILSAFREEHGGMHVGMIMNKLDNTIHHD